MPARKTEESRQPLLWPLPWPVLVGKSRFTHSPTPRHTQHSSAAFPSTCMGAQTHSNLGLTPDSPSPSRRRLHLAVTSCPGTGQGPQVASPGAANESHASRRFWALLMAEAEAFCGGECRAPAPVKRAMWEENVRARAIGLAWAWLLGLAFGLGSGLAWARSWHPLLVQSSFLPRKRPEVISTWEIDTLLINGSAAPRASSRPLMRYQGEACHPSGQVRRTSWFPRGPNGPSQHGGGPHQGGRPHGSSDADYTPATCGGGGGACLASPLSLSLPLSPSRITHWGGQT